jgi:hypothetical protein
VERQLAEIDLAKSLSVSLVLETSQNKLNSRAECKERLLRATTTNKLFVRTSKAQGESEKKARGALEKKVHADKEIKSRQI